MSVNRNLDWLTQFILIGTQFFFLFLNQLKMTAANRIRVSKMLPEDTTASTTTTTGTPPWIPEGSTSVDWNDPSTTVEIISTTVADLVGHNTSVVSPTITNNTERVATIVPETAANIENRLRWIDYRRQHSAYPPRVPNVPGIPSGFRNPLANVASNTANANTASLSEIENNQPPEVNMYNPGTHHSFFSGASSNPMGFGGAVNMDDVDVSPFKVPTTNTVRRYNITRVERKLAKEKLLKKQTNKPLWYFQISLPSVPMTT